MTLNHFAFLYTSLGQYQQAIPLYREALAIIRERLGDNNGSYGGNLIDLGYTYYRLGQYKEALPLFVQAAPIIKEVFGEKHTYYAMAVNGLALIYERIGDYSKSELLYLKVSKILKKALGENHPQYAYSLNNLATFYKDRGAYNEALNLYQKILDIRKKVLKVEHPDYGESLRNLAVIYEHKGRYDTALHLHTEALAIIKKSVGEEHQYYTDCLANLASLYARLNKHDTALLLYKKAFQITTKVLGEDYPDNVNIINSLGKLYTISGNGSDGNALFIQACKIQLKNLVGTYSALSEQQKMTFLNKEEHQFSYLPSAMYLQGIRQPAVLHQLYQNEIALKGMVLEDQQQVLSSIRKSGDSIALSIYNQWRFNKTFLGKEYLLPKAQRIIYLDSLEEATTQQEQELSRRSAKFKNQQSSQTITPNDIARNLHQGEASVEFIKFQLYKNKWTDSILYGALVLLPGDSIPKFEILFEENQLKKLIVASGSSAATYTDIQKLYGGMNSSNNTPEVNYSLYRLIWKPLEKYLSGVSNIYYVPAGLLHRISFQALRYSTSHYLLEKYQLNQLLSTRSIAYSQNTNSTYGSVNIWGNINYNITNKTAASYQNKHSNNIDRKISPFDLYALATRSIIKNGAAKLPSKMREIDSIQIMLKQMQVPVITTVGSGATEKAFKALNGKSQQVLHLATHGFFLPISQSKTTNDLHFANAFTMQQDPMFRSGLMLAGGNYAWKGGIVPPDKEDGILTAYELAQMDLSNTQLMVLSACETALGDLQGTEGVIGLQRAIKLAGVKQMIVSLWKVPDKETVELMTMFYRNWLTGQTTRQAMRNAQLNMKEKYSPFYWAAFVLVE